MSIHPTNDATEKWIGHQDGNHKTIEIKTRENAERDSTV